MKKISNEENLIIQHSIEEIKKYDFLDTADMKFKFLSNKESRKLVQKISKLPYKEKNLLYMTYVFNESDSNIKDIFDIQYPRGERLFLQELLSKSLGFTEWISDEDMKKAVLEVHEMENEVYFYNKLKVNIITAIVLLVFLPTHIILYNRGTYGEVFFDFEFFLRLLKDLETKLDIFVIILPIISIIFPSLFLIKKQISKEPVYVPYYYWEKNFNLKVIIGCIGLIFGVRIFYPIFTSMTVLLLGIAIVISLVELIAKEIIKTTELV